MTTNSINMKYSEFIVPANFQPVLNGIYFLCDRTGILWPKHSTRSQTFSPRWKSATFIPNNGTQGTGNRC